MTCLAPSFCLRVSFTVSSPRPFLFSQQGSEPTHETTCLLYWCDFLFSVGRERIAASSFSLSEIISVESHTSCFRLRVSVLPRGSCWICPDRLRSCPSEIHHSSVRVHLLSQERRSDGEGERDGREGDLLFPIYATFPPCSQMTSIHPSILLL